MKGVWKPCFERNNFSSKPGVWTSNHRVYTIANQYHWWISYNKYGWMSTLRLVIHLDTSMLSFRISKDRKWTRLEHIPGAQSDRSINTSTNHPQHSKIHSKQSTASPSHLGLSFWVHPSLPTSPSCSCLYSLAITVKHTHRHKHTQANTHTWMIAWLQLGTTSWSSSFKVNTR